MTRWRFIPLAEDCGLLLTPENKATTARFLTLEQAKAKAMRNEPR